MREKLLMSDMPKYEYGHVNYYLHGYTIKNMCTFWEI
jgi:hypothetical protein